MASAGTLYALDLGSHAVKFAEARVEGGRIWVTAFDRETLGAPVSGNTDSSDRRTAEALGLVLKRNRINPKKMKQVISALPGDQVHLRQIRSVALPEEELKSSLLFEARKHLPVEGEVLTDYQILGQTEKDLDILLAVTPRETVVRHLSLLSQAGIEKPVLEAPVLSVINRVILSSEAEKMGDTALFVEVGASATHLAIVHKDSHLFCREIPFAGNAFSKEIGEKSALSFEAAEKRKLEGGIFSRAAGGEKKEEEALSLNREGGYAAAEGLVREIIRSVRYFAKEFGRDTVDSAFLSGGSSADPALREYLEKELGRVFQYSDPLAGLIRATDRKPDNPPSYTQTAGMLLRGAREFFPDQFK